ncbi:DUF4153 domain-containing protein [Pseudonocardia hydrocarbonoxydans]|uniref:Uncharacterized protein n=1 Tax=Pseudonocardia hydrocarbonoxydans TaxID=76726 RepID=A0A4Y3WLR4_9PSEU|nr:DUF4173 domain-containing protein [Pseudonocardia hydrocarbonoxydans]GEC19448.1 hypothetical protein PHY01_17310 [Pseudonocardia hydrocarbonoxydans]
MNAPVDLRKRSAAPLVPPPPPLFPAHWPGPPPPASRTVLAAAAVAGAGAAVAVPQGPPGLGWPLVALLLAAVTLAVQRRVPHPVDAAWGTLAVALAAVAALRDAEWLVTLCLLGACAAGSLAVAGRSFRGIVTGALALPVAALRGLPWVARGLVGVRTRGTLRLAVAAVVGLGLVAVFGALLTSADAAFAGLVDGLVPAWDGGGFGRAVWLFALGAAGTVGACFLLAAPPEAPAPRPVPPSRLRPVEWALPVGLLVALFAAFVAVQFRTLFGSDDHVLATTGLTYAEYARSGFWQLLAVTVLALGVIVAGARLAPAGAGRRGLLSALAGLTLVIVASALSRLWLYQEAYGFTVLRLLVLVCELWLGLGFVLVLGSVLLRRPRRPLRAMAVSGALALLALAALDPERFVAGQNVARFEATGRIDTAYLADLSADAVPALARLPEPYRSCALEPIAARAQQGGWREANVSRAVARGLLADVTPSSRGCGY